MAKTPNAFSGIEKTKKFGPFLGVFTPSVLTILGVIMYLRFGWVVANAGLLGTISIVLICCSISLITALSASAVATNSKLGAGGEYYMISRSLGLTIGGAIGIPLFLCYILSITLYCFGLAEVLIFIWPSTLPASAMQWIAAGLILIVITVSSKSAHAALRLQIPLMACVGLSIIVLALGVLTGPLKSPQWTTPGNLSTEPVGFWVILAVFFPAVTGFSAGIGMSGDLKDPQKAIPKGTILAVLVGAAVYLIIPVLLSITAKVDADQLAAIDPSAPPVWTRIALLGPWLIFPGICGAILSSAFGSALAGPRVLQALASDELLPAFLGKVNKTGQPVIATWVAGAIALSAVMMGNLNAVARLVTILFLTLYMTENLVATIENIVKDPSYRPTLKVHWSISLIGVIGIIIVMLLISVRASLLALGLEAALWMYLRRKNLMATWGNVWSGIWGSWARLAIYNLTRQIVSARSWRPNILLFADNLKNRLGQVRISAWFNQNSGILTVCDILSGHIEEDFEVAQQKEKEMAEFLESQRIVAFSEVDVVEDFETGVLSVIQANGTGTLRSNTIAFGWPRRTEKLVSLLKIIRKIVHIGKAALIIHSNPPKGPTRFDRIDVWWRGKNNNGDLMLMLAYLLTLGPRWRNATIYIRSIATTDFTKTDIAESLENLIEAVRIKAKQDVITLPEDTSVIDLMHETSKDADLVFVGMMTAEPDKEEEYAKRLSNIIESMPTTVLVRNSGPFQGQLL